MTDEGDVVTDERRDELLDHIAKRGATIGERIPEEVTIDGQPIALRSFVWETKKQGTVPPEKRESVRRVRTKLEGERERLEARLREAPIAPDEAEAIAHAIVGIDRAIGALKNLREPDFGRQSHDEYIESNRRWIALVDQLL